MRSKGRNYGMDARAERNLCALMRERGQLAAIEINGQMRAGMLCTLAGNELYMHVIAHDPAFDELRLGYLCCVLGIEAAITQRLQRFHFLWGWYDYKTRLGGQRRALEHALLWRSGLAACRHPLLCLRQHWLGLKAALRERRLLHQQAQASQAARAAHAGPMAHGAPAANTADTSDAGPVPFARGTGHVH
jgi:CelD/BcsL family acetyltransferase involved in cellulose biosynthesis